MEAVLPTNSAAIWEEIDVAESYLVCCMFEKSASLAAFVIQRLIGGSIESIEDAEFVDIMESAGMVFIQSLNKLGRTSELVNELKVLFGTVTAIPGQVLITGACMQIAEGFSSTLQMTFDEFLSKWKYIEGHSFLFLNEAAECSHSGEKRWPLLNTESYLHVVEAYALTILGTVTNDTDLAICWIEKAELPEERRQEILRRLHSFCSAKNSSSPVAVETPQLVDKINNLSVPGAKEGFSKNIEAQKHPDHDRSELANLGSFNQSIFKRMTASFWWFRAIHLKCGDATLILPREKIMFWGCLVPIICYVLLKKRAMLQRIAARQLTFIKRTLIDAWQLAFSVQVNPLAAIQPLPSTSHGSR
uniref:Sodium channel protein type 4 subunit alpha A n=1 Tax=Anthurium amnicola TaxID=1678845 RepID=A0A1D1XG63_9ARAE